MASLSYRLYVFVRYRATCSVVAANYNFNTNFAYVFRKFILLFNVNWRNISNNTNLIIYNSIIESNWIEYAVAARDISKKT